MTHNDFVPLRVLSITDNPHEAAGGADRVSIAAFDPLTLRQYHAAVVTFGPGYRDVIKRIRRHDDLQVYLKPIFLLNTHGGEIIEYGRAVLDGEVQGGAIDRFLKDHEAVINGINTHIAQFTSAPQEHAAHQYGLAVKAIRFIHSRNNPIKPIRFPKSIYAYSYPFIDILITGNHYQQFTLIDFLENRNLIEGTFVDRVHCCSFCYASFLNFREICVNCQSPNISNEDLIHHFPCGYMGPESDFMRTGKLICPKCRKNLKHIGVDFDRPSQVFTCSVCTHSFQEPDVDALCVNCGKTIAPEKLLYRTLKEFKLTPLGEASALSGIVYSLQEELRENIEVVSMDKFNVVLNLEIERVRRYKKSLSTIVRLVFDNYADLLTQLGSASTALSRQIVAEIADFVRTTDLVAFIDDRTLLFLLTETSVSNAKIAMDRLMKRITALITENLSVGLKLSYKSLALDGTRPYNEVLKELAAHE